MTNRTFRKSMLMIASFAILVSIMTGTASADATASGTAVWKVYGTPYATDSGVAHQYADSAGPYGETTCKCVKSVWGVCQSYEGTGHYLATWNHVVFGGKLSTITWTQDVTRQYDYHSAHGYQSFCNTQLAASREFASATARGAANTFQRVSGGAYGEAMLGASAAGATASVPFSSIATFGSGTFSGSGYSWGISYTGSGTLRTASGIVYCASCVIVTGSSTL